MLHDESIYSQRLLATIGLISWQLIFRHHHNDTYILFVRQAINSHNIQPAMTVKWPVSCKSRLSFLFLMNIITRLLKTTLWDLLAAAHFYTSDRISTKQNYCHCTGDVLLLAGLLRCLFSSQGFKRATADWNNLIFPSLRDSNWATCHSRREREWALFKCPNLSSHTLWGTTHRWPLKAYDSHNYATTHCQYANTLLTGFFIQTDES